MASKDFIGHFNISHSVCDKVIEFYNLSDNKFDGTVENILTGDQVDPFFKQSTECFLIPQTDAANLYLPELKKCLEEYIKEYKYCNEYGPFAIIDNIKIQHYLPGQGFFSYHAERGSCTMPNSSRHLVFMTYLNDVEEGGETEFYYQDVKIKPKKGLTLIWPADWTHTHRGITSPTEDKFIITGWYNFIK